MFGKSQDIPESVTRALVADDNKTSQLFTTLLLQKLGIEVVAVDDGNEAVKKVLSEQFDLVFMDMQMPVMDGFEATKTLRQHNFDKPIIAVTARVMENDKGVCIEAGCDAYIAKPINRNILRETVSMFLEKQKAG